MQEFIIVWAEVVRYKFTKDRMDYCNPPFKKFRNLKSKYCNIIPGRQNILQEKYLLKIELR